MEGEAKYRKIQQSQIWDIPQGTLTTVQKELRTKMVMAALFEAARGWKQQSGLILGK